MHNVYPVPPRVRQLIDDLNHGFWAHWATETQTFPDTEECSALAFSSLKSAMLSIFINYLLGFELPERTAQLENFVQELRYIELLLRDEKEKT